MRRNEFKVDDNETIEKLLSECEHGVLSLISDNKPYGVAVNFVYFDNKVYIHGSKEGRKMQAIKESSLASFIAIKAYSLIPSYFSNTIAACPATQFFASVILEGNIHNIKDGDKKAEVLNKLMEKLQSEGGYEPIAFEKPMYKKMLENTAVLELKANNISCKIKAGQNLSKPKKDNLLEKLEERDTFLDKETISLMKENN